MTRVRLRTLVREELRALPRNTFALAAVALVGGALAVPLAFLYTGEAGLGETLLFTWFLFPLVVAIVVAARIASARRTRFVDSLYTTPLMQRTWFAAQAVVGVVLALLVLALQVPALLVHVAWLGAPATLPAILLGALGIAAFAVALGLFCGVIVGDASPLAAAGVAGGLAFLSFILFVVQTAVLGSPASPERDLMLRVASVSPMALAVSLAGLHFGGVQPATLWRPALGLAALVLGLAAAAWFAYTRAQGPLGWDGRAGRAVAALVALVLAAVAVPIAGAEVSFVDGSEGEVGYAPGESTWIAIVERGAPITDGSFSYDAIYTEPDLPLGKDVALDALVLVVAPPGATPRGVHVEVKGSAAVRVVEGGILTVAAGNPEARVPPPNDDDPRPVFRVPVTLRARSLDELGGSPAPIEVHTEFTANGQRIRSVGQVVLEAELSGAPLQLAAAGLLLPAIAGVGFAIRKRQTR